ncbi:MAG: hypothetical protein DMG99_02450 [Acidobacteria bacterium]|nr:MAG: hypothetical protein DMG99_02450 [Acidobacteriota bacterium]
MRKGWVLGFILLSFTALASAQIPTGGNIYAGYSYFNTNMVGTDRQGLNGWEGSLEGKFFPFVGIVADFSANYGDLKFPSPAGTCAIGVACSPGASRATSSAALYSTPRSTMPASLPASCSASNRGLNINRIQLAG